MHTAARTMAASLFGFAVMWTPLAMAGDIQGDAYACDELWQMRNTIYKSNGYCFRSPKAIAAFGNAGCLYDDESAVPVSDNDRLVLKDIRRSEARQGC